MRFVLNFISFIVETILNIQFLDVVSAVLVLLGCVALYPQTKAKFKLYYQDNERNKKSSINVPASKRASFFRRYIWLQGYYSVGLEQNRSFMTRTSNSMMK